MMNNGHKKTGCDFDEEMVSYLYGETSGAEKAAFETHLKNCLACAEEVEAFSGVQFSINDWKLKEFANLETPRIEIPYEKPERVIQESAVAVSWLPSFVRDLFSSFNPRAWSLAAASVAILAVCVGLALIASKFYRQDEVSQTNTKQQKSPTPAPDSNKQEPVNNIGNSSTQSTEGKQTDRIVEPKSQKPETAVSNQNSTDSRAVKASNNQRQKENANLSKDPDDKRVNKNNKNVPPGVVEDEDEDKTLRLAEIFEEIDTRE
jgi:hypothetical protein